MNCDMARMSESIRTEMRVAMARRNVSMKQLHEHLGMSATALHRRMTGVTAWDVDELASAAALLGVDVVDFFAAERAAS